jgi:branched-chain amino acid transport system permease protein
VLPYLIAGLALGGIYAIAATGLVVTYLSAGILNFSFGATAFFIARLYYYLHTQHGWGIVPAAVMAVVICAPALGVIFYLALFRLLRLSSPLIKIVATVGLAVALPALATLVFGNQAILSAPGLAPQPVQVFHLDGVPITMTQLIVYGCVILVMVVGAIVLRYSDIGLRVRAMVDSPALTSLSGTSPAAVSIGVWAASTFLAGLAGVLCAPIVGLTSGDFTLLMAGAFAAVVAAKLRNLPVAAIVGLGMGVAGSLLQKALPPNSTWTQDIIPSIPFAVTAIFLVYFIFRSGRIKESEGVGGALDRAIAVASDAVVPVVARAGRARARPRTLTGPVLGVAIMCMLPFVLTGLWTGVLAVGVAYAIIFLSFTLVIGEGGMVWLCMITFAGVGGLACGQFAALHGWPVLAAAVMGGLIALPMGIIIGALTIRLGELYVALVTLTFGLLMEDLVFHMQQFMNSGIGITIGLPSFASTDRSFTFVLLAIFVVVALFIVNVRRSTTGMALTAVRWSEPASKTVGVSVLQMKVVVAGIAAFLAGLGGALLAVSLNVSNPANYSAVGGLILVAVVATLGIRSTTAALIAGLSYSFVPALFQAYLPTWVASFTPLLFGLGAIAVARYPEGTVAMQVEQVRALRRRYGRRSASSTSPPDDVSPTDVPVSASIARSESAGVP